MNEIKYQIWLLRKWMREKRLRWRGVDRSFYCQRDIEGGPQCETQCDHCKEYYKPLEQ